MAKSKTSISVTGDSKSHPVAQLYGRWVLNPLVEIAHTISHDFAARPRQYREVLPETANILADFRFKFGSDRYWPDAFQRTLSFKALHQVNLAAPALRQSAILLNQKTGQADKNSLMAAFLDSANEFRNQIESLEGPSLAMNSEQTASIFNNAVNVIKDPGVAKAFGLPPAPARDWPLGKNFSTEGAYLVERMIGELRAVLCLAGSFRRISIANPRQRSLMPKINVVLSKEKFIAHQKAAVFGGEAISLALSGAASNSNNPRLMDAAYNWALALQKLVPDPARAWKDLEYRSTLTDLEWGLAPNPAGNPTQLSMSSLSFSTATQCTEICCSSGDLDCDPTVILTDFCTEFCPIIIA